MLRLLFSWNIVSNNFFQLQWPRTPSEKLLHDMFEGSSTQLLCILEALNDTNRRILITSPPAPDADVEILDVYAELFMAGQEILAGIKIKIICFRNEIEIPMSLIRSSGNVAAKRNYF